MIRQYGGGGKATLSFTLVNYICKLFVALVPGGTLEDQITLVLVKKGVIDCEVGILLNFLPLYQWQRKKCYNFNFTWQFFFVSNGPYFQILGEGGKACHGQTLAYLSISDEKKVL